MVRPLYFNGPGGFLSGNVQSYKVDFSLAFPYFPVRISERNPMPREPLGKDGGFHINLPQTITTDEGIEWKYYAWYTFYGGASDIEYGPYDPSEYEELSLDDAFSGFAGNMNGTVVKIFGRQVTGTDGLGILISALWPYGGEDADGKGIYLNGIHEEPLELYYLVRKDVAEGALLEIPDSSSEEETSLSTKSSSASYSRILR